MAYTVAVVVAGARKLLGDNNSTIGYRKADSDYINYLNEAMAGISLLRPELFETIVPFTMGVGAFQKLGAGNGSTGIVSSVRFRGCDRNDQGYAMNRFEKAVLDRYDTTWGQATTTPHVRSWCEHETIPDAFWVHPPATLNGVVYVRHVAPPSILSATSQTLYPLPDSYLPMLIDYIVHRESASDDASVMAGRAVAFFQQYMTEAGVASRLPAAGG